MQTTRLAECEHGSQFPPPDVHIQRFDTDIQKAVRAGEFAELAEFFDGVAPFDTITCSG